MSQTNDTQTGAADDQAVRDNWYTPRLVIVPINVSTEGVGTQTPEPGSSRDVS